MYVILPYNSFIWTGECYPEYLTVGAEVTGYHYNEKRSVKFPITKVERLEPTRLIQLKFTDPKLKVQRLSGLTKVLTQGGPIECYKAPYLIGVCQHNPRQLNIFNVMETTELTEEVSVFRLEWDDQNYFMWAEGILVGSLK